MAAERSHARSGASKSEHAFRTIGEVSESLDLPQHVLRFWETRFSQIRPLKRGGNRRYYRPEDIELLKTIKTLLYQEGYTIRGVQKRFREHGIKSTIADVRRAAPAAAQPATPAPAREERASEGRAAATGPDMAAEKNAPAPRADVLAAVLEELRTLRRMLD
ncbi:MAG: MerR family transcriptional regulator [Rhodothalassiaceae bacterium]